VPAVLLRVWLPAILASAVRRPNLSLAFRAVAPRAQFRETWLMVRLVSAALKDCMIPAAHQRLHRYPAGQISIVTFEGSMSKVRYWLKQPLFVGSPIVLISTYFACCLAQNFAMGGSCGRSSHRCGFE
jgi:hypothetical protein